jgi:hypothetical protein
LPQFRWYLFRIIFFILVCNNPLQIHNLCFTTDNNTIGLNRLQKVELTNHFIIYLSTMRQKHQWEFAKCPVKWRANNHGSFEDPKTKFVWRGKPQKITA